MKKSLRQVLAVVSIFVCLTCMVSINVLASRTKVSYKGEDFPPCPDNQGSVVKISVTDASRAIIGDTMRRINGDSGFTDGSGVNSSAMYLVCNGVTVGLEHAGIDFISEDDGNGNTTVKFDPVDITSYDQTAIDTIVPTIDTKAVWCTLYIPEKSGCLWTYPNGMLLDRVAPNVTGGRFETNVLMGLEDGQAYWSWMFDDPGIDGTDPGTRPDTDGENGTACGSCPAPPGGTAGGKWCCNQTDTRFQWQFFRRKSSQLYNTTAITSTDGSLNYITDTDQTTTRDRFAADSETFCYSARIQDSAGNWSIDSNDLNTPGTPTKEEEKCIKTDGKYPTVEKVEYFTTYTPGVGFSGQFPYDYLGKPIVTSNPCQFSPTCDISVDRFIELRITMNEPLFDGVNRFGYTYVSGDDFDNDNDGTVDDEAGGFDNVDNDLDGLVDEDVENTAVTYPFVINDRVDNDADGYVDEHSDSAPGADSTSRHCESKQLFNRAHTTALGADTCFDLPLISIDGIDSEGRTLNQYIEWICTQDGVTVHPECTGLSLGQTIYRFKWRVGRAAPGDVPPVGLEEGYYDVTLSAMDGVGNKVVDITPLEGSPVWVDNTAPDIELNFFTDNTFTAKFTVHDHDNDPATEDMAMIPETTTYFTVTLKENGDPEYAGATPEVYIFLPDARIPTYEGEPQAGVYSSPTVYSACGQAPTCNLKTGANCTVYDPVDDPCETFRGAFTIDSSTMNDGYAAVTVSVKDRYSNRSWHMTDAEAAADQVDDDRLSDDVGLDGVPGTFDSYEGDGIPNYVSLSPEVEKDITLSKGQFFAIDTTPPATPSISLPIAPCKGTVARQNSSCNRSSQTVNNPILKWTILSNGIDDDVDGTADEEYVDGWDEDGDDDGSGRWIDEDAKVYNYQGTFGWEVSRWRLQVSTTPTFATGTLVRNTIVSGSNYAMPALDERPITSPYYWRIAAFDYANNMGPYNPQGPMVATATPYFTFAVDVTPPQFAIDYYSDINCSVPMATAPDGTPVTGDTVNDPDAVLCMTFTSNENIPWATEPTSMPAIVTYQQGFPVQSTTTVPMPAGSLNTFRAILEIDAKGSGLQYVDGLVEVRISAEDPYGNKLDKGLAVTNPSFYVDSAAPECTFESPAPNPASMDNNANGIQGELDPAPDGDAVTLTFYCNKYLGASVNIRVKQNGFNTSPLDDDLLDNDCDGLIDEDPAGTGTDSGSSGPQPGSGCWFSADFVTGSSYTYTGYYNVVPTNYDGEADVFLGDNQNPNSIYFVADQIGNPVYAETTFDVDTQGPTAPQLTNPINNQVLKVTLPQFKWTISPRSSDLAKYIIEVATSTNFTNIAAYAEITDDNFSTNFFYTLRQADITECQAYSPVSSCPGLSDSSYYWRMYSVDTANNRTKSAFKLNFYVDTQPPGVPVFNAVTTPTTQTSTSLSGYTSPAEKNATVNIYRINAVGTQTYIGSVKTDSSGNFTVGTDDDSDGFVDEDPVNGADDDFDGETDEDPPGIFLNEGKNFVQGLIIDSGGNTGTQGCSASTPFYNAVEGGCVIVRDSGAPTFDILYYSDAALTQPLQVIDNSTYKQVASATTVFMYIVASEELANPPTFTVDQQGTTDISTTSATPLTATSTTEFIGQFTVFTESAPQYVDGDAKIVVIGTDLKGNQTAAGTIPNSGGYLTIDTKVPFFRITYWSDAALQERLPKDNNLLPVTKARDIYLRITPNELLSSNPTVNISQPGSMDISGGSTTIVDTTGFVFKYKYTVMTANGTEYIDGSASVEVNATDLAGNTVSATPVQGDMFYIDTTRPLPPTISIPYSETEFTQITVSGSVKDIYNNAEAFADIEIYVKLKIDQNPDDELNNDGDGRIDEEPNGYDGIDNDNDLFIDEDVTDNVCATGYIWDASSTICITALKYPPAPNGTAITNSTGGFTTNVSRIMLGLNYVYARATDIAGNTSEFSVGTPIIGKHLSPITLNHTFPAGWNLVGVPLQPAIFSPSIALGLGSTRVYQLKDGEYVYSVGLDSIAPGMCYWIYLPLETTVTSRGVYSSTNMVKLQEGWNLISIPYEFSVPWDDNIQVSLYSGSGTFQLGTTDANLLVEPYLYTYNGSVEPVGYNAPIGITDGYTIYPWTGFAIKALQDSWLIFPSRYAVKQ